MSKDSSSSKRRRGRSSSRSQSRSSSPESKKSDSVHSHSESRSKSRSKSRSGSSSRSSSSSISSSSSGTSKSRSRSRSYSSSSRSRSPASQTRSRSPSASRQAEPRRRSVSPVSRIHINRLTRNVNKNHLTEIFKNYGTIKSVDLPCDRFHPQLNRGSAYIEFEKSEDAEKAIKYMDGGQIDGQEIIVTKFRKSLARPIPIRRHAGGGAHRNGNWRRFSPSRR